MAFSSGRTVQGPRKGMEPRPTTDTGCPHAYRRTGGSADEEDGDGSELNPFPQGYNRWFESPHVELTAESLQSILGFEQLNGTVEPSAKDRPGADAT